MMENACLLHEEDRDSRRTACDIYGQPAGHVMFMIKASIILLPQENDWGGGGGAGEQQATNAHGRRAKIRQEETTEEK